MAQGQEIASFYASIGVDAKELKKGLGDAKDSMSNLEKSSNAIGTAAKVALGVGVTAVVGFGAAIGSTVKSAADFEQGVTDIGATMGLTADETDKLQDHIMDLGLDPKLKVSASEASEAIMSLGTAGLSLDQILGGASKATVQLSNATGGDMAKSASLMTDIMGQYGITAEDTGQIVNQITGLTVASKFAFDDVALAFGQVGGVAASVGLSLEDTSAILGVTAKNFNSGSDAATSLKTMLTTLIPKSNEAEDAMAGLGLITTDYTRMASDLSKVIGEEVTPTFSGVEEAFKKTKVGSDAAAVSDTALGKAFAGLKAQYQENQFFDDTTGQMKSAADIAGILQGAFGGLSEEQKNEAASTIFGTDAMRTAFGLIDGGTPAITKMTGEIAKVDAGSIAAKRMDTFGGALEIAQGVIETLSIQIGQQFLPVLRPLIEKFSELATTYGPQLVAFFGQLANSVTASISPFFDLSSGAGGVWDALKGVWDAMVPVIAVIREAIKPIIDITLKFIKWQDLMVAVGIIIMGPVLGALGALIAASLPVIQTIVLITAAVSALRNAWEHNFMGVQDITKRVWQAIIDTVGSALDSIGGWLKVNTGVWKGDWSKTLDFFVNHSQDAWSNLYDSVVGYVGRMINEVRHNISVWVDDLEYYIRYYVVNTKMHLEVWAGWVERYFNEAKDYAIDKLKELLDWFQPRQWYDKGMEIIQGLWDGAKDIWNRFSNWWSGLWSTLTGTVDVKMRIGSPSKEMEDRGAWAIEGFAKGAKGAMPMAMDAMNGLSMGAMNAGTYAATSSKTQDANPNARLEQLLMILIQTLQSKNMSPTVNVQGGGGLGSLVSATNGLR